MLNIFSKNNNTPPDLDDLFRHWRRRFTGARPRRPKNGDDPDDNDNGGNAGWPLPPTRPLIALAALILVTGYLFSGFFTVDANERVVIFWLGNPSDVRGPGLKWHLPPLETYRKVNVSEVRRVEVGYRLDTKNKNLRESLMLTGNLNIIDMQFVVQYALNDPELFLFENRFPNQRADEVVQQVAETAMRELVGRNNIDFVLYEGREAVAEETRLLMQDILNRYKAGIEVQQVAVQNVQPPDQVQDAFEDAIKARQDRERKINEGQAYANNILPRAQGQASRIIKNAEGYKESVIVQAGGETERFLLLAGQYRLAPAVTRRRLYLETVERVMGRARKILLDDTGTSNLLYLPIDQLAGAAALPQLRSDNDDSSRQSGAGATSAGATLDDFKNILRQRAQQGINVLETRQ